jgi:lipopolysaccharide/colanic/teichoic acid biosynthesis glycosyltransferase
MNSDREIINRDHKKSLSGLLDPNEKPQIGKMALVFRKLGIDEAPQLWNLLIKRDMQLLGIRPYILEEFHLLPVELREKMLQEKPGLIPAEAHYGYEVGNLDSRIAAMEKYFELKPRGLKRTYCTIMALMKRIFIYSKR